MKERRRAAQCIVRSHGRMYAVYNHKYNKFAPIGGELIILVSKETIQKYNKKYKTSYTVKSLTKTQATKIAKKLYYDNFNIGLIENDKLAIAVFDFIYNSNPSNAAKCIEKAAQTFGLKVKVDGVLTKEELKRMNTVNANDLANQICKNRLSYIQGLKVWKTYKKGWTKRVNSIKSLKG